MLPTSLICYSVRCLAAHGDAVVRSVVIALITAENGRHVTDDTLVAWVVLARTLFPSIGVGDMDLTRSVVETKEHPRKDGDEILLVVDVREVDVGVSVDVICEVLIADTRQTVHDSFECGARGQVQREVYAIEESDSCSQTMARRRHRSS